MTQSRNPEHGPWSVMPGSLSFRIRGKAANLVLVALLLGVRALLRHFLRDPFIVDNGRETKDYCLNRQQLQCVLYCRDLATHSSLHRHIRLCHTDVDVEARFRLESFFLALF